MAVSALLQCREGLILVLEDSFEIWRATYERKVHVKGLHGNEEFFRLVGRTTTVFGHFALFTKGASKVWCIVGDGWHSIHNLLCFNQCVRGYMAISLMSQF